jgi:hypothetical protein
VKSMSCRRIRAAALLTRVSICPYASRARDHMVGDTRLAQIALDRQERHPGLLAQLADGHREPILLNVAYDELRPPLRRGAWR